MKLQKITAAIVCLCSSVTIQAEVSTFGELDNLRSENYILELKAKNAELRNRITETPTGSMGGIPIQQNSALPMRVTRGTSSYTDTSARVQFVSGVGTNVSATIALGNGTTAHAKVGSKVANLGTVKSLSANEVIVWTGKEYYSIPFASEISNNFPTNSGMTLPGSGGNTVPGVIPMGGY